MKTKFFTTLLILTVLLIGTVPAAGAGLRASQSVSDDPAFAPKLDNRPDPLTTKQAELKEKAIEAKLNGKAYGHTHAVARGQYVELEREGEDPVWTVLGEFPDLHHNEIAEPDRTVDNSTIWVPDFSRDGYYMEMLFSEAPGASSMRNYFIEQSSNRYTVYGDVTDWVEVPDPAATYDDDITLPDDTNAVWYFLADAVDGWYQMQLDSGKTPADIDAYLSDYDIWDRYDYDGDGDFNEPDGYIDHIQFVHAGLGNEACVGTCDWAIWSHSWYAFYNLIGTAGPDFNKYGGTQIGDSSYWVGKYTIQPENGGVGVFAHEYGHDLGLPDLYSYYGENSCGFWTLMASGSWLSDGTVDIGSKPNHMGVWEKFQLGWLNYEVAYAGQKSEHKLGPAETNTKQAQGLFVVLPKKSVPYYVGDPYEGSYYYYSGSGDLLDHFMYKSFTLADGATLAAKAKYDIELDWDYAYLVYSTDGGNTWIPIQTNLSTDENPYNQNFGHGITGSSDGEWVDLTADLPEGDLLLGFRYWTDRYTTGLGFMVDNIEITGYDLDGAETDTGWTYTPTSGFHVTDGNEVKLYNNYYVAEFRQYRGYDQGLRDGVYNFGWATDPVLYNWVERYPYQDGLLISYWDTSQRNNNVGLHPGQGLLLPIDAHPEVMYRADSGIWRNRAQTYDSTFSLEPTDAITLHWQGAASYHPSLPAVPVFDDNIQYYRPENPLGGVINPHTGTQIRIQSVSTQGSFMQVQVRPSK